MSKKAPKEQDWGDDPRFIKGIYNYCDRWCEHCAYQERCLLYAGEEQARMDAIDDDSPEEDLLTQLEDTLQSAEELILSIAAEQGIDPAELAAAPPAPIRDCQDPVSDEMYESVRDYQVLVKSWLDQHPEKSGPAFDSDTVDEHESAVQIINWYRFQIGAKLHRGLESRLEYCEEEQDEAAMEDANGSVKVALIGIDRSIAAWSLLDSACSPPSELIQKILGKLKCLRSRVESEFPDARSFMRPGFDYSTSVQ